jgi:uncharacterized protein (DUF2249 family)
MGTNTFGDTRTAEWTQQRNMTQNAESSHDSTLDARKIDGEPFGDIMSALAGLPEDGSLLLINSFEPEPLYDVLEERGFEYASEEVSSDEWHVEITPA